MVGSPLDALVVGSLQVPLVVQLGQAGPAGAGWTGWGRPQEAAVAVAWPVARQIAVVALGEAAATAVEAALVDGLDWNLHHHPSLHPRQTAGLHWPGQLWAKHKQHLCKCQSLGEHSH